jgi:hypothetical protein
MNASHMDAPTVLDSLAPQGSPAAAFFTAREFAPIFTNTSRGTWSLIPGDSRGLPSRAAWIPPSARHLETLLAPHKRRRYSCFRFARGVCPKNSVTSPSIFRSAQCLPSRAAWFKIAYTRHTYARETLLAPKNADVKASQFECGERRLSILPPRAATSCHSHGAGGDVSS